MAPRLHSWFAGLACVGISALGVVLGLPESLAQNEPFFESSSLEVGVSANHQEAVCPHDLLSKAYLGLADESPAVLDIYAVEREVLLLCRERQELLLTIARNDALLREKLNIQPAGRESATLSPVLAPVEQVECIMPEDPIVAIATPTEAPLVESVESKGPDRPKLLDLERADARDQEDPSAGSDALREPKNQDWCRPPLSYSLHAVMRAGSHWQARLVTMEGHSLRVKRRDILPDGRIVTDIHARGIEIGDHQGHTEMVPLRARPSSLLADPAESVSETSMVVPGNRQPANPAGQEPLVSDGPVRTFGEGTLDIIEPEIGAGRGW